MAKILFALLLAASAARAQPAVPQGTIPLSERVIENPDDVELNYQYAHEQVRAGDIRGAAVTLERVLLVNPDWAEARLFYAVVLFRLDDIDEAEREFHFLVDLPMERRMRLEIQDYLRAIDQRRKRTRLAGRVSEGVEYDTNRNAIPSSGKLLFVDIPLPLSANSQRAYDVALVSAGSLELRRDLGAQSPSSAFGSVAYQRVDQSRLKGLDIAAYSAEGGLALRLPWADVIPSGKFDHVELMNATFIRSEGGKLQVAKTLSRRLSVSVYSQYLYSDYLSIPAAPFSSDRSGDEWSAGVEAVLSPASAWRTSVLAAHADHNAAARQYAYRRDSAALSESWTGNNGVFLRSALGVDVDRYKAADPFVSANDRYDTTVWARAAAGYSLDRAAHALRGGVLALNYEFRHAYSNLTSFQFVNHQLTLTLSYRWDM